MQDKVSEVHTAKTVQEKQLLACDNVMCNVLIW
jgi:hypothetical protein